MKKLLCMLCSLLLICSVAYAETIQGGVKYTVDSARSYVQDGQEDNIDITGPYFLQADNIDKIVYSRNPVGDVIGITVRYKGNPCQTYIYNAKNKLIYVEKYDRSTDLYPHRGYRYDLQGKLILTSLTVSKNEMFRFDPEGNLIARSVNGIVYDENGKIIGSGK